MPYESPGVRGDADTFSETSADRQPDPLPVPRRAASAAVVSPAPPARLSRLHTACYREYRVYRELGGHHIRYPALKGGACPRECVQLCVLPSPRATPETFAVQCLVRAGRPGGG